MFSRPWRRLCLGFDIIAGTLEFFFNPFPIFGPSSAIVESFPNFTENGFESRKFCNIFKWRVVENMIVGTSPCLLIQIGRPVV